MKKLFSGIAALCCGMLLCASCSSEPDFVPPTGPTYTSEGLLVLNNGNYFNQINGSLSYLDYATGMVTDGVFAAANQRSLGGTPNDMLLVDDKLYICCTDENRVEVVSATNFISLQSHEVEQPRCVCAGEKGVYVSSYDGTVTFLSFDGKMRRKSAKVGACLEGIETYNGEVYVCNAYGYSPGIVYNANLVKLDAETLAEKGSVSVACNPVKLKCRGGKLYLLSSGNYADVASQLQSIDKEGTASYVCDATLFDVAGDDIYAVNSVTDWTTFATKTEYFRISSAGERTQLIPDNAAKEIFSPCAIAVDYYNRQFFISSYNAGAMGYADYSGKGYVVGFGQNGNVVGKYDVGVGPCVMTCLVRPKY